MTESEPTAAMPRGTASGWTCARCEMTVRWGPEAKAFELPSSWVEEGGVAYCLSCRRDRAGDAAMDGLPVDAPSADRQRARSKGRLEFEILRDPGRPDSRIAKACRTSTPAVRKVRAGLGLSSPPPA